MRPCDLWTYDQALCVSYRLAAAWRYSPLLTVGPTRHVQQLMPKCRLSSTLYSALCSLALRSLLLSLTYAAKRTIYYRDLLHACRAAITRCFVLHWIWTLWQEKLISTNTVSTIIVLGETVHSQWQRLLSAYLHLCYIYIYNIYIYTWLQWSRILCMLDVAADLPNGSSSSSSSSAILLFRTKQHFRRTVTYAFTCVQGAQRTATGFKRSRRRERCGSTRQHWMEAIPCKRPSAYNQASITSRSNTMQLQ